MYQTTKELLQIEQETGLTCLQKNRQRIFCPKNNIVEQWPQGSEIYIKNFPVNKNENLLFCLFKECGRIMQTRLMVKPGGENRGFAYVLFEKEEEADLAIKKWNLKEIRCFDGLYRLNVMKSRDCRRLFLGNIPRELKKQEIFEVVEKHTKGLTNVLFLSDWNVNTKNRGYCFLDFETHKKAIIAKNVLYKVLPEIWFRKSVYVNWATPEPEADKEQMEKVKTIFIRGLTLTTSITTLCNSVSNAVGTNNPFSIITRAWNYAFVLFAHREPALLAVEKLNGSIIDGVEVEAQLARPTRGNLHSIKKDIKKPDVVRNYDLAPNPLQTTGLDMQCTSGLFDFEPQHLLQIHPFQTEMEYELQCWEDQTETLNICLQPITGEWFHPDGKKLQISI